MSPCVGLRQGLSCKRERGSLGMQLNQCYTGKPQLRPIGDQNKGLQQGTQLKKKH